MSTNKTENYHLHAWEPQDDFLLSEINENFAALDSALAGGVVIGSYQGDGTTDRVIELGFTPAAVLVENNRGMRYYEHIMPTGGLALKEMPSMESYTPLKVSEGGFTVGVVLGRLNMGTNDKNYNYFYIAFRK